MVRTLLRVSVAAAVLSVLVHFYIRYRGSMYTMSYGANAFDVTLWRLTEPGWYITSHSLPHEFTDCRCDDAEGPFRPVWFVPTLVMFFNALLWSAAATGITLVVRCARHRLQPSNQAM